ncbi:hypothetical protein K458DRAFT_407018 [Lentithecium fluviatile CBS 122367]|uniref:Uncharacterized protein n=1 Tax=Lentithecium fluviatile CBS 122367 TaxID=1168545 RepID=A0A6G1IRJ8_9PLEO|nr:hypothetical protein K458DRAFT_407018 [Lentithecium fluviatile CBS 122367]
MVKTNKFIKITTTCTNIAALLLLSQIPIVTPDNACTEQFLGYIAWLDGSTTSPPEFAENGYVPPRVESGGFAQALPEPHPRLSACKVVGNVYDDLAHSIENEVPKSLWTDPAQVIRDLKAAASTANACYKLPGALAAALKRSAIFTQMDRIRGGATWHPYWTQAVQHSPLRLQIYIVLLHQGSLKAISSPCKTPARLPAQCQL